MNKCPECAGVEIAGKPLHEQTARVLKMYLEELIAGTWNPPDTYSDLTYNHNLGGGIIDPIEFVVWSMGVIEGLSETSSYYLVDLGGDLGNGLVAKTGNGLANLSKGSVVIVISGALIESHMAGDDGRTTLARVASDIAMDALVDLASATGATMVIPTLGPLAGIAVFATCQFNCEDAIKNAPPIFTGYMFGPFNPIYLPYNPVMQPLYSDN